MRKLFGSANCPGAARCLRTSPVIILLALLTTCLAQPGFSLTLKERAPASALAWPNITPAQRPHAYWWWLGSAVDRTNITRELERYRAAGMGGMHIIPIYGAKGWEKNYIDYLSPEWMEMLRHCITEGRRLGLEVDMTTGTGWCFGGPEVTDLEANARVVLKTNLAASGSVFREKQDRASVQALVAFDEGGMSVELTDRIQPDGSLEWPVPPGNWTVYSISQKPSGQKVKRAGPGGAGHMLNLFYTPGMEHYLERFDHAFKVYDGPRPRAMYHDSYEYQSQWSPDLFTQFEKRRGYRLQTQLAALLGGATNELAARVKCDYRETLSDIMAEETLPRWSKWCRERGMLTRNQAHGSPGNLLDLYATADIPETEMFRKDRNVLISKFASSAAHVTGRKLVASETGTWLKEHFTETLADMKYLLDDLFLGGVSQVFYHGTCYSPDEAGWPGWLFYASYEMNPRNSIWRDVPALNEYVARCQSFLQSGSVDNDVLVYWPIHDYWHQPAGMDQKLTVHHIDWFEGQAIGHTASNLWKLGFGFDYISDRQLAGARVKDGSIAAGRDEYRALVVPACRHIPHGTLARLTELAAAGANVIFEGGLPSDVPGLGQLEQRRAALREFTGQIKLEATREKAVRRARTGSGQVLAGDVSRALQFLGVQRESMTDHPGLCFIRLHSEFGRDYFVANRGEAPFAGWLPLAAAARSVVVMDPMTGATGVTPSKKGSSGNVRAYVQLAPGASLILRAVTAARLKTPAREWSRPAGADSACSALKGEWQVRFIAGGPVLPAPFQTDRLGSWTDNNDPEAQRFAGTAVYSISFDAPRGHRGSWFLDLGRVCQSARVRLNGQDLGTLLIPPFQIPVANLMPKDNRLEVEVTNVSANRIRDLDRRKVEWRVFNDINFVNIDYKPFDASEWPVAESGLLGPVTLAPARPTP